MKKLGKKLNTTMDTIEAYTCDCEPAKCQTVLGDMYKIVTLGIRLQG